MTPSPVTIEEDTSIDKVQEIFRMKNFRHLPVVSKALKGKLVGVISQRDTKLVALRADINQIFAADLMSRNPLRVPTDMPVSEAIAKMTAKKYGCLIVMKSKAEIAGIFTTQDALRLLLAERNTEPIKSNATPPDSEPVEWCDEDDDL